MVLQYGPAQPRYRSSLNIAITFTAGYIELNGELQNLRTASTPKLRCAEKPTDIPCISNFECTLCPSNISCSACQEGPADLMSFNAFFYFCTEFELFPKHAFEHPESHTVPILRSWRHCLVDPVIVLACFEGSLVLMQVSGCSTWFHVCAWM